MKGAWRVLTGGLLGGVGAMTSAVAVAQEAANNRRTFAAPARAITITVSSNLLYDTNVTKGSATAAALRGVTKEDFRVAPVLAIDATLPRGAAVFSARGSIGYEAYARNERLNRERIDLGADARLPIARCDLAPEGGFTRRQNDLADLSIDPAAPPGQASVNVQTTMRVEGQLSCGPTVGFRPAVFAGYSTTDNSAAFRRAQDVDVTSYGAGLGYANPTVGIVTAFLRRADFTYDRRRVPGSVAPTQFHVTAGGLRIDRRLGARLQLVGSLSYADVALPASFGRGRDLDGINWNLAATLRIGERMLLAIDSERAIESSPGFFANFVRKTNHAGSLTYAVSPLLRVGISAGHRARDFQTSAIQPDLAISRDTIADVGMRADYTRGKIRFRLDATYQRRNADRDLYDFDGFQAALGVTYVWGR